MKTQLLTLASLFFISPISHAATISFDSAADLTDNFTQTTTGPSTWGYFPSGGNPIGGNPGGGFATAVGFQTAWNTTVGTFELDTSADQTFVVSSDFRIAPGGSALGTRAFSIGITNSVPSGSIGGGFPNNQAIFAGLEPQAHDSGAGTSTFNFYTGMNADGSSFSAFNTSGATQNTFDENTWYHLETTWNYINATDSFNIDLEITNADQSVVLQSLSLATGYANPFGSNPTLHAFFGGQSAFNSGIAGVDNFTSPAPAIPEPSSTALIVSALACAFWRSARRRE